MKLIDLQEAKYARSYVVDWIANQLKQIEFPTGDEVIKGGQTTSESLQLDSREDVESAIQDIKDKYGEPTLEDPTPDWRDDGEIKRYGWDFKYKGIVVVIYASFYDNTIEVFTMTT
jgi:hypothetical protein